MRYLEFHTKLLEAQNYDTMFAAIRKVFATNPYLARASSNIAIVITNARTTLKRHDRIIWYLRWYRLYVLLQAAKDGVFQTDDPASAPTKLALTRLLDAYVKDYAGASGLDEGRIRAIAAAGVGGRSNLNLQPLEHFLSLPIAAIQNLQFSTQPPQVILDGFAAAEKAWQEENAGTFAANAVTGAKVVIQFSTRRRVLPLGGQSNGALRQSAAIL